MPNETYIPKYKPGDQIILDGQYTTILDLEDGEYRLTRKGRLKWIDAREIDAVAKEVKTYDE